MQIYNSQAELRFYKCYFRITTHTNLFFFVKLQYTFVKHEKTFVNRGKTFVNRGKTFVNLGKTFVNLVKAFVNLVKTFVNRGISVDNYETNVSPYILMRGESLGTLMRVWGL